MSCTCRLVTKMNVHQVLGVSGVAKSVFSPSKLRSRRLLHLLHLFDLSFENYERMNNELDDTMLLDRKNGLGFLDDVHYAHESRRNTAEVVWRSFHSAPV